MRLRSVEIITTKSPYSGGESVEGLVIVRCSRDFKYNAIHLTFAGRERTEIVVSAGEYSTTYKDERVYFTTRQRFGGEGVIPAGETRFPFAFTLPENILSSYSGKCGWVEYTLRAVVEISKAIDLKKQIAIRVKQPTKEATSQSQTESVERDGRSILDAEIHDDCVCLGDPVIVRFRVSEDLKMRGIRVELRTEEDAIAKRQKSTKTRTLVSLAIPQSELARDLWTELELKTNDSMPLSFEGQIVSNRSSVKLTLDIPWARDKWIVMPVKLGYYAPLSERDTTTSDFQWRLK